MTGLIPRIFSRIIAHRAPMFTTLSGGMAIYADA